MLVEFIATMYNLSIWVSGFCFGFMDEYDDEMLDINYI